jgi:periplasmic divalent cation tolerance protein
VITSDNSREMRVPRKIQHAREEENMVTQRRRQARRGTATNPGTYVVVLVTCGSRPEAARVASSVVAKRLAACVNIFDAPVRSIYRWKGKVEQAREFLLVIKSSRARLAPLRIEIERLHSYEMPEFIVLPILTGAPRYLAWLAESVRAS